MSTALAPIGSITLFEIEERYLALLDTEALVSEEQQQQFQQELATALQTAVEKRDRVAAFLRHCETQAQLAAEEMKRLAERKRLFERAEERMREYVLRVIESMGTDAKGKAPKLEGKTVTFSARACPPSVKIANESDVPDAFKSLNMTLPLRTWQRIIELVANKDEDLEREVMRFEADSRISIDLRSVKTAIENGCDVPGADLSIGKNTLVVK